MSVTTLASKKEHPYLPRTSVIVDGRCLAVIPSWLPSHDLQVAGLLQKYLDAGHADVRTKVWTPQFIPQSERTR